MAAFIGSPSINLFKGRIVSSGDGPGLQFGEQVLPLPADQAVAAEENGNRGDALDSSLLAARLPGTFHVATGETVELGVDLDQLYASGLDGRAL